MTAHLILAAVVLELAAGAAIVAFCLWRFYDVHGRWPFIQPRLTVRPDPCRLPRPAVSARVIPPAAIGRAPLALPAPPREGLTSDLPT